MKISFKIVFLLILFLAIFLRVQYLDKTLMADETVYFDAAKNINLQGRPIYCNHCLTQDPRVSRILNVHPPLFLIYLSQVVYLFNLNEGAIKLSIVIFSVASVLLIYFTGKMLGGQKVGLISMFLLAIISLHIEHSQVVDIDGSFFTFFILLTIFSFLKWQKTKNNKYFILFILSFIFSILTKESAILLFPVLFFYFLKEKKVFKFFKILIIVSIISFIFLFFFKILLSTNFFEGILDLSTGFALHRIQTNILGRVYQFLGITTWKLTPPLLIFTVFSIFYNWKKENQFYKFLIIFLLFYSIFYILLLGITRYFVPIVPVLCLLVANYIKNYKIKYTQKTFSIIAITATLCFISFYLLGIRNDTQFLNNLKNNFLFIIVPYGLCVIPFGLYFTKYKNVAFVILIGMLIGYNIFFAQESINPLITPDFNKAVMDASDFIKNPSLEGPLISMYDISFYSNRDFYYIEFPNAISTMKNMFEQNKTFYVVYRTNSILIQPSIIQFLDHNCTKIANGVSRNVEVFKAFKC